MSTTANIDQLTSLVDQLSLNINNINIIPLDQKLNTTLNTSIPTIKNDVASIKSNNSTYQMNHNNLNSDLKTQTTNLQTIQKQNNINSNNSNNLNTLHNNLSNKLSNINNNNLNTQSSQSNNKTMIDNLNNNSSSLMNEIQTIKLNLEHIKTQITAVIPNDSQYNNLDSNYNNLSSNLKQVHISTIIAQQEQNNNYSLLESLITASNSDRSSNLGNNKPYDIIDNGLSSDEDEIADIPSLPPSLPPSFPPSFPDMDKDDDDTYYYRGGAHGGFR
jgi:chromosome segregation ATPase